MSSLEAGPRPVQVSPLIKVSIVYYNAFLKIIYIGILQNTIYLAMLCWVFFVIKMNNSEEVNFKIHYIT